MERRYRLRTLEQNRKHKYNDAEDLDELCKRFLSCQDTDPGAAIEYCKNFLTMLSDKPIKSGAVLSSRAKSR